MKAGWKPQWFIIENCISLYNDIVEWVTDLIYLSHKYKWMQGNNLRKYPQENIQGCGINRCNGYV
jgi:hypothetical protein